MPDGIPRKAGQPRKDEEKDKVAIQLIKWAKLDDSVHLCNFCVVYCDPPISPLLLYQWGCRDKIFCHTYEIAKAFLACRREERLNSGQLHVKAFDLNASTYDYFLEQRILKEITAKAEASEKAKAKLDDEKPKSHNTIEMTSHLIAKNKEQSEKIDELLNKIKELEYSK